MDQAKVRVLTKAACARLGSIQEAYILASSEDCAASLSQRASCLPSSPRPTSDDFIMVETARADKTRDGCTRVRVFGLHSASINCGKFIQHNQYAEPFSLPIVLLDVPLSSVLLDAHTKLRFSYIFRVP